MGDRGTLLRRRQPVPAHRRGQWDLQSGPDSSGAGGDHPVAAQPETAPEPSIPGPRPSTEARRRGWRVERLTDDGVSGKHINAALREVLTILESGQADDLIVAKLDRLARSVVYASNIIRGSADAGRWLCLI
ncbi:recombinase family protein [Mycolicibacterium sp. ND9-15]|uniref:recombinase family protein n=1 Tax=Mycolicibacterium sp. ND9-15 TaxID=3042320 RepID=UPI002DDB08B7|nr:recombinase family protein [Mycolicibacterium sp. ND9-15]WSE54802.1 recombinase family protein [Mycolicibacterium sp. ND9-15]